MVWASDVKKEAAKKAVKTRGRNRRVRAALEHALGIYGDEDIGQLREIMMVTVGKAMQGDMKAIEFIADRMDGSIAQQIELRNAEDEDGNPMPVVVNVVGAFNPEK